MLPECEIKIGLDPAAQDSPAVLEVRRGNPLSWCLANLHGILLSWTDLAFENWSGEFGGSWGFCHHALTPRSFPEKTLAVGAHVGLPQRKRIGMPLCLGTGNKRDSLRLLDGGFKWTATQSMDSSPCFAGASWATWEMCKYFCPATRKTAELRAGGGGTSFPQTHWCENTGLSFL